MKMICKIRERVMRIFDKISDRLMKRLILKKWKREKFSIYIFGTEYANFEIEASERIICSKCGLEYCGYSKCPRCGGDQYDLHYIK